MPFLRFPCCLFLLACGFIPAMGDSSMPLASSASGAELPALKVEGNSITANGEPIRLRGINWGWWHLSGTRYSEPDMKSLGEWGANVVRLAFSYNDLETDNNPPAWKEDGFKDLDEVVQWGKRYGIHVILDMHITPGGQSAQPYCAGGKNLLWKDPASQQHFIDLWTEIARRYCHRPEVAAYELMNEPETNQPTPDKLVSIDQRAISAIRAVDPDKIIVVGGDHGSGPQDLNAALKLSDNNILYTFHFYEASGNEEYWISTASQPQGRSGTHDWVQLKGTFTAPVGADLMTLLLRSDNNSGSAWFKDAEVTDASGKVLQSANFDQGPQGYHPERWGIGRLNYDSSTGRDKPGTLKVAGTTDYNGWAGDYVPVQPGHIYHATVWVKLDQATGKTYPAAAFFNKGRLDRTAFQKFMKPATDFGHKFNVPVWVGEFGCDAWGRNFQNENYQSQWVTTCISIFEEEGFDWTYWNDKETSDPQGMGLRPEKRDGSDVGVNESLLAALRAGWTLNSAPAK